METTLYKILECSPHPALWNGLLKSLDKSKYDDECLSILTILDLVGLDDALWCTRTVSGHDKELRLYAVWCAVEVEHLISNINCIRSLEIAELFANGEATTKELNDAYDKAIHVHAFRGGSSSYANSAAAYAAHKNASIAAYESAMCTVNALGHLVNENNGGSSEFSYIYSYIRNSQKQKFQKLLLSIDSAS